MNSNTLETDAACKWWLDNPVVDAAFARKLERERNEARDERDSARDAYQIVKDSLHEHSTRLETLLAACDDHADGSVDATPLGKFCNDMVGLSNGIMLHEVSTLRAEVYKLRETCDELAAALKAQDDHHSESCVVFFEQDGKPIEISTDLGEAYQESELCEKTGKAISNYKSIKK